MDYGSVPYLSRHDENSSFCHFNKIYLKKKRGKILTVLLGEAVHLI